MAIRFSALLAEVRQDIGDPNGVHPIWTTQAIFDLIVNCNRHFSHVTRCLTTDQSFSISLAGGEAYNTGGEVVLNTAEAAYLAISSTYHRPMGYRDPYSVPNWGTPGIPIFWGVQIIQGYKWIVVMPRPATTYSLVVTGTRVCADSNASLSNYSELPDHIASEPRHLVMCRLYQMIGDVGRAKACRMKYWQSVRRVRQSFVRSAKRVA